MAQLAWRMSAGKMSPWKPSPLGKGLTLSTDDRNVSWIPANTVFQPPICAMEQLGSWALCRQGKVLGEKAVSRGLCDGHKEPGKSSCVMSSVAGRKALLCLNQHFRMSLQEGYLWLGRSARAACSCSPPLHLPLWQWIHVASEAYLAGQRIACE